MKGKSFYAHCDVCVGTAEDRVGWLDVLANQKGRKSIEALFPSFPIEWTGRKAMREFKMPKGWKIACLHLPNTMKKCPDHKLGKLVPDDPDDRTVNIYGMQLGAALHLAGCKVITRSATGEWNRFKIDR